jgi:alpha-ribazole phosphatase
MKRFWLIRHAVVIREAQKFLYGRNDVPVCTEAMAGDAPRYAALAARLPRPGRFLVTPLSRTHATAAALMRAGYPAHELIEDADFIEQDFGTWQGQDLQDFSGRPVDRRHPFWPIHAAEQPPQGESFSQVIARVGGGLERLARAADAPDDTIVISHGGAIRAACAHALSLTPHQALSLSIENISLTRLERGPHGWRVVSLNEHL